MMNTFLFALPLMCAIVGAATAWLMVYMLIQPAKPVNIMGFSLHGFLFREKPEVAKIIGGIAADRVANDGDNKLMSIGQDALTELNPIIEQHIDTFLLVKLKEKLPVIATFVGESTMKKLKAGMMEEIELLLPEVIDRYISSLAQSPEIKTKIADVVNNYPDDRLAEHLIPVVTGMRNKAVLTFGTVGGVIGGIGATLIYCLS